jgi:steroid 5-alpha reductase family enzyme
MSTPTKIVFALATCTGAALLLTSGLPFVKVLSLLIVAFTLLWMVSLAIGNASIVDIFWGPGFVLVGCASLLSFPGGPTARGILVVGLATIWATRLALHIGIRNAGAAEDFRYRKWREEAGSSFWWISYFKVFLLQAVLLWIVSSPLLLAQRSQPGAGLTVFDGLGIALFVFGFALETIADRQLARFKRDPNNSGQVMRTGLWSRSRHPNYFGEAVLWWGLGLLALPTGGWLALIGPVLITFMLIKVSGVAMLDAALIERRPGYAEYVKSTPAFFPSLAPAAKVQQKTGD